MVRFTLAASTLQKAAGRQVASIGSVTSKAAAARLTSSTVPSSSQHFQHETSSSLSLSSPSCQSPRYLSTSSSLQDRGIMDSNNLLQFNTLHELQKNSSDAFKSNPLFGTYEAFGEDKEGGEFKWMSYEEWGQKVDACRTVLKDQCGVEEYSKIGIISNNRWEWATLAAAAYSLNATLVPMYEAQLPKDWSYILNDSGCCALFCATQDIYDRAQTEVLPSTPSVKSSLCLDAPVGEPHAFATAMAAAESSGQETPILKPTPDDLANLVYTSGTTGKPKGVELLHSNSASNVMGVRHMVEDPHDFVRQTDRSLAFLPWAHSYGQTCELWCAIAHGASMGVGRGVPFILEDLSLVKPTTLFAVPTLYKRIYDGVHNMMETSSPTRKKLIKKALALGHRNADANHGGPPMGFVENLQFKVLDSIVLNKIRDRFGGNMRHGFVAGAACPKEIIDFMDDIGIPICEGYGLTETSPIITLNTPYDRQPGSCGRPLYGVNVVIMGEDGEPAAHGEEGEICCYGPNVMRGYYKNPDATAEVITPAPDGKSRLFHTGDLGRMSEDGWVRITGRLKEQYKLENGKYVCPTPIEEAIGMSRFISQVVLCGANRPHNVALIVPDWAAIRTELGTGDDVAEEELVNDDRVRSLIQDEIKLNCSGLKKFEVPLDFTFVAPFTAANNMLTPKMSIRRHMVIRTYEEEIAHMYGDEDIIDHLEPADGAHHEHDSVKAA